MKFANPHWHIENEEENTFDLGSNINSSAL